MKFFVDNNLSKRIAQGLRAFGEDVTHLQENFASDEEDHVWLEFVGQNSLVLVTRDDRIRWRPSEIKALRQNGVGAFFLGGKNLSHCQIIQQIIRNWPRMKEVAGKAKRPFAYRVPPTGSKFTELDL